MERVMPDQLGIVMRHREKEVQLSQKIRGREKHKMRK